MRLLRCDESGVLTLTVFLPNEIPPYAILSHTWSEEEVTYEDIHNRCYQIKQGWQKIRLCIERARADRLEYFWVDSCCINKDSSAELSEALNSMYRWYASAEKCYVYLSDVVGPFTTSRWFFRGWTLQELIAPAIVEFYDCSFKPLGTKIDLGTEIHRITNIPVKLLRDRDLDDYGLDERMEWQEERETTRSEDMVYSLLGLLEVSMSVIYGEGLDKAKDRLHRELRQKMAFLNDLEACNPWKDHETARALHEVGTGDWLLESFQYRHWKTGPGRCLWLHGKPGCGKTVLCSTVVEDLRRSCAGQTALAIFYFSFADKQKQNDDDLVRSLLYQLGGTPAGLKVLRRSLTRPREDSSRAWVSHDIKGLLTAVLQAHEVTYIVMDALDECSDSQRHTVLGRIENLLDGTNTKIFITSRELLDIQSYMEVLRCDHVAVQGNFVQDDIRRWLSTQLESDRRLLEYDAQTRDVIRGKIAERSSGMFRYAYLQLQEIKGLRSRRPKSVLQALYSLPGSLDEMYAYILNSISFAQDRRDALTLLSWLVYAQRPLSLEELVETVVIQTDSDTVDCEDRGDFRDALRILSSLVTIIADGQEDIENETCLVSEITPRHKVRLAHYTVKEYLESERSDISAKDFHLSETAGHRLLESSCLKYMISCGDNPQDDWPLYGYAARFWPIHSQARMDDDVRLSVLLLTTPMLRHRWLHTCAPDQLKQTLRGVYYQQHGASLYQASFLGLVHVVRVLLIRGFNVNLRGGRHCFALHAACYQNHEDTVELLLEHGADVNAVDEFNRTALHRAARMGHINIIRLLLAHGPHITTDSCCMTALHYAVIAGHAEAFQAMIKAGISIDTRVERPASFPWASGDCTWRRRDTWKGLTALHYAALTGNLAMVRYLIALGADTNAQTEFGETPAHLALLGMLKGITQRAGHQDYWRGPEWRMVNRFRKVSSGEGSLLTKLREFSAMERSRLTNVAQKEVLDALLSSTGMDPNLSDCRGFRLVHCVDYQDPEAASVLHRLLQAGARILDRNDDGQTGLHLASAKVNIEAMQVFLAAGADVRDQDFARRDAIFYASMDNRTFMTGTAVVGTSNGRFSYDEIMLQAVESCSTTQHGLF